MFSLCKTCICDEVTGFSHMTTKRNKGEHKENKCVKKMERQLPTKSQSLPSPFGKATLPSVSDGAPIAPRLYTPRWCWSAASTAAPPVLGEAPQCHPLDILGVFDPPIVAASIHCALADDLLGATQRATQAFGAPPFAVMLAILTVYEARLQVALRPFPDEAPIRVGLFGPGAAAARRAAMSIHPEVARHLTDLYSVRGAPDNPDADPLPRGVWPVLCPVFLPARPAPMLTSLHLPPVLSQKSDEDPQWQAFFRERVPCNHQRVLMSICAEDAQASYLPPDVRRRVTALPRLMEQLYASLATLAALNGAAGPTPRCEPDAGASVAEDLAETALELAMTARAHMISFYARVRPAPTGSVHRAAAAMLRHRPLNVSPTTLTSGINGGDLRVLEAAGWLEGRDEETVRGLTHRFCPTREFLALKLPELPRKRPSLPKPIKIELI